MDFKDRDGKRWVDVVICAGCGFMGRDLNLVNCPRDGRVLGETSVSPATAATLAVPDA